MVLAWYWRGTSLVLVWYWRGTRVVLAWYWRFTGLVLAWYWCGTGVVLAWHWRGTGVVLAWYWLGTGLVLAWYWRGTGSPFCEKYSIVSIVVPTLVDKNVSRISYYKSLRGTLFQPRRRQLELVRLYNSKELVCNAAAYYYKKYFRV